MKKTHWIRKHRSSGPLFNSKDKAIKFCYWFDVYSACGRFAILNGTVIRKNVTCKNCLKIMKKRANLEDE